MNRLLARCLRQAVGMKTVCFITQMTARKAKFGTAIVAVVAGGVGIPLVAVWWTQKKASG